MSGVAAQLVSGEQALAQFREGLSPDRILAMLETAQGRLLIQLPVGIGKSHCLRAVLAHAISSDLVDLALVLVPRRDLICELVAGLLPDLSPVVLQPRPRAECAVFDGEWQRLETAGCSLLAKHTLCTQCPRQDLCRWLGQYDEQLAGAKVVVATQAHLAINPAFVARMRARTGAQRMLTLVDESDLFLRRRDVVIGQPELEMFVAAQRRVPVSLRSTLAADWLRLTELFLRTSTRDLREGDWRCPALNTRWALAVQQAGRQLFADFRFSANKLSGLVLSDPVSRERLPNGSMRFAIPPRLGDRFIVFSGSVAPELVRYRLDPEHRGAPLCSPFAGYHFSHPGTRWYNLAISEGAARYFRANVKRIIYLFAHLICRNIAAGRRTLLVARKKFIPQICTRLTQQLAELGQTVTVVTAGWDEHDFSDPRILALINYGTVGINRFEGFDSAFCIGAYYVNERALQHTLYDLEPSAAHFPVRIVTEGRPPQRVARVDAVAARATILPHLAQWILIQRESDVVIQAVGRVRPFTKRREIITTQLDQLPGVQYTAQFETLKQACQYFGVPTRRAAVRDARRAQALELRRAGVTNAQIAAQLGITQRSVRRILAGRGGHGVH